jgi:hypothetical protein
MLKMEKCLQWKNAYNGKMGECWRDCEKLQNVDSLNLFTREFILESDWRNLLCGPAVYFVLTNGDLQQRE